MFVYSLSTGVERLVHIISSVCVCVCVCVCVKALCECARRNDIVETIQLVFSGADVRYVTSLSRDSLGALLILVTSEDLSLVYYYLFCTTQLPVLLH